MELADEKNDRTSILSTVPARILIQVRDGVLNEIAPFDLEVRNIRPAADTSNGAKEDMDTPAEAILKGLAIAYSRLAHQAYEAEEDAEWLARIDAWKDLHV